MKDAPIQEALEELEATETALVEAASDNALKAATGRLKLALPRLAEEGVEPNAIVYDKAFLTDAATLLRLAPAQYESIVYRAVKSAGVRVGAWSSMVREQKRQQELLERPVDFQRGDHVELAERLLRDLQGAEPVEPVSDQGDLFLYESTSGVWRKFDESELMSLVSRYAGARVASALPGRTNSLRLQLGDLLGSARVARARCRCDRFFDNAPDGLAFRNGYLALEAGALVLRAPNHEHRATFSLPFDYDASAQAPRWVRFLEEVFRGQPDVQQRIALIEEWIGTVIFGLATAHEACLLLVGQEGNNGKSVLLHVLTSLFPPSAQRSISPQEWGNNFFIANFAGARLNVVNEIPDADIVAGELFKAIVSGNSITAAHKGRDPFTFCPRAGHIFACNSLPGTRDQSGGFWKRWIVLTFERTFAPAEQNPSLRFDLVREEMPGIAARVASGVARFVARGRRFDMPETAERAKAAWRFESDQVAQFFDDRDEMTKLIEANRHRPSDQRHKEGPEWTSATPLYAAYATWAKASGHAQLSKTKFGSKVKTLLGPARWVKAEDYVWYRIVPQAPGESGGFDNNPPGTSSHGIQGAGDLEGSGGLQEPSRARAHEHSQAPTTSFSIQLSSNPPEPSIPPGDRKNTGRMPGGLAGGFEQPSSVRSVHPTVERFVRECCATDGSETERAFGEAFDLWASVQQLGAVPRKAELRRALESLGVQVTEGLVPLRLLDEWLDRWVASPPASGGDHGTA